MHDRLTRWASGDRSGEACVAALDPASREAWEGAVERYAALTATSAGRLRLRVRYALVDPTLELPRLPPVPEWLAPALAAASPAYRRCWWEADDRANRAWIAALASRLARAEEPMASRISRAHHLELPDERVDVDVVPWVSDDGAETVVHPHHILIGSTNDGFEDPGSLEMIFHELSHTIVSPRSEGALAVLRAASPGELPPELWHVILFETAGVAAQATLRELFGLDYTPFVDRIYARDWARFRAPMQRWWRPYLAGELPLEEAARGLVTSLREGETAAPTR